jgi:hypothetical protein
MNRLFIFTLLLIALATAYSVKPTTPHVAQRLASAILSSALILASPLASLAENDALEGAFRAMNAKSYSSLGNSLNKAVSLVFSEIVKKTSE